MNRGEAIQATRRRVRQASRSALDIAARRLPNSQSRRLLRGQFMVAMRRTQTLADARFDAGPQLIRLLRTTLAPDSFVAFYEQRQRIQGSAFCTDTIRRHTLGRVKDRTATAPETSG